MPRWILPFSCSETKNQNGHRMQVIFQFRTNFDSCQVNSCICVLKCTNLDVLGYFTKVGPSILHDNHLRIQDDVHDFL